MMDVWQHLARKGIHPVRIFRASEQPGASGSLLDRGTWRRIGPAPTAKKEDAA